ncbi:MAG: hypothetical protein K8T26_11705 [Lentisphaerae bacterium]|nr:hypothetical protein [Lentisphaerota bacterium]
MRRSPFARVRNGSLLAACALTLCACSRSAPAPDTAQPTPPPAAQTAVPPEKSTTDLVVDGITGRTAIQAGQKARATIDKVNTQRNEDMAEADKF